MTLAERQRALGAALANDGIPLHFGDQAREYHAALEAAVLMDRSHEGRLRLSGQDRLNIMHRISTNDLLSLEIGHGRPTVFTNPNARILDRAIVCRTDEDAALVLTEPGRGEALKAYLGRNVFFNDELKITDLTPETRQFVLHGATADAVIGQVSPGTTALPIYGVRTLEDAIIVRDQPLSGSHWRVIVPTSVAAAWWDRLLAAGERHGLIPAGSLTYNVLRISAGRPGVGRELSTDYIPLEVGLWDEVNFKKGCYTGQEIIARMESRGRLAKTIAALSLAAPVTAPAPLTRDGREIGILTSAVTTPDGEHVGIGVIKLALATPGQVLSANGIDVTITRLLGAQPPA
ncbi:MAG: aminomethyl transferase family protein [Anaerolinea sp.]|nr:aminomethyl transferase family protein [Anaerolinea sp.]